MHLRRSRGQPHPGFGNRRRCAWVLAILWGSGALLLTLQAQARDPTTMSECVSTLRPAVEARCREMLADPQMQSSCLQAVAPQVKKTCEQFFGAGRDFCAECTSGCTRSLPAGDPQRRECLSMCMAQPGCR